MRAPPRKRRDARQRKRHACATASANGSQRAIATAWTQARIRLSPSPASPRPMTQGWPPCASHPAHPRQLRPERRQTSRPRRAKAAKEAVQPAAEPALQVTRAAAAAKLQVDEVPAAGEGQALLTVEAPGRFSIRAQSKTGVALQLVDMLSGPGEKAGDPATRDGRLDMLLDKGVYKIKTFGAEKASGAAKLSASAFHEAAADPPPRQRL